MSGTITKLKKRGGGGGGQNDGNVNRKRVEPQKTLYLDLDN